MMISRLRITGSRKTGVFLILAAFLSLALLASACGGGEDNPFGVKSEVVTLAERPTALAFAPDGRLFYGELFTGNIRIITPDGELQEEPFAHVDSTVFLSWGLTGLALDPDFETNGYVYAIFTESAGMAEDSGNPIGKPVLVRFTDENNKGVDRKILVGDLPDTNPEWPGINGNGGLHFGPDGFLYFTLGDYNWADTPGPGGEPFSLDFETPIGKMLRIDPEDGEAPPDNPFVDDPDADARIFARGFLKAFDFTFHPETGELYGTDGTTSCEELNIVTAGGDYGWPDVGEFPWPDCFFGDQIDAIHLFAIEGKVPGEFLSVVTTSGMEFVSGDVYPIISDALLVCETETNLMRRVVLTGDNFDQVTEDELDAESVVEDCLSDIAVSPEGIVYYGTETEIRQLIPEGEETSES